ncbi:MAG: hypothetical protein HY801_02710 [Candidatus Lindowbacteria bacterium]|nr:hypothetical protein [Candidatus Lindowbacteria bacterium]
MTSVKNIRKKRILVVLTTLFVGCATVSGTMPSPEQLMAEGVAPGDADVAALARGRAIAITECTGCHRLYWPHEYSPEVWPGIVRKMGYRASLTEDQIQELKLYLVTASQAARRAAGANVR